MSTFFLYLFIVLTLALVVRTIITPKLIFEFPYFIGAIFCIFILPQSIIISNQPHLVPNGSLTPLFAMCFLCLAMSVVGYNIAPKINIVQNLDKEINLSKLFTVGVVYTILGFLFLFLIYRRLSELKQVSTQWSGILTIYFQLFQIINIGFPILLYLALLKPNFRNIFFASVAALPFLYLIFFSGRREVTAFFVLTIALSLFYRFSFSPPRIAVIAVIVLTLLIIPATGDYRALSKRVGPVQALSSLDLKQSFINYYNNGKYLELEVAGHLIDTYSFDGNYRYGGGYWDQIVFRYVPAQILGPKFKKSLMFHESTGRMEFRNGYKLHPGLTITGMGDAYMQFGLLGCFFFFFLGGFFRSLWTASISADNPLVQILYMVCIVQALLSVTHQTTNFIPGIIFSFICLWGAITYARN